MRHYFILFKEVKVKKIDNTCWYYSLDVEYPPKGSSVKGLVLGAGKGALQEGCRALGRWVLVAGPYITGALLLQEWVGSQPLSLPLFASITHSLLGSFSSPKPMILPDVRLQSQEL
jgi:hypothetical protein